MKSFKYYLCAFVSLLVLCNSTRLLSENGKNQMVSSSRSNSKATLTTKFCNPLCKECSSNDRNYCTICNAGVPFYQYNCFAKCPDGTFLDQEWRECKKCNENCPICWGPDNDMCGTTFGLKTTVTSLEHEIKEFLSGYTFSRFEIEKWVNNLKFILTDEQYLPDDTFKDSFRSVEVYSVESDSFELPIGSYSDADGVFIPVPAYINKNKELVNSHWIFKQGQWDGKRWVAQFYPRLPTYIRVKGSRNKIYYENNGYWVYDTMKGKKY